VTADNGEVATLASTQVTEPPNGVRIGETASEWKATARGVDRLDGRAVLRARACELELPDDFRDVLVVLADEGAELVLIGGWAMAVHGRPRATEDLDVLVRATPANSTRVVAALAVTTCP
jgi:hypothetical protein